MSDLDKLLGLSKEIAPVIKVPFAGAIDIPAASTPAPTFKINPNIKPKPSKNNSYDVNADYEDRRAFAATRSRVDMARARKRFEQRQAASQTLPIEMYGPELNPSWELLVEDEDLDPASLELLLARLVSGQAFKTKSGLLHRTTKAEHQLHALAKAQDIVEKLNLFGYEVVKKGPAE